MSSSTSHRIAFVIGTFFPHIGGAQVFLHNLLTRLAEKGHEPLVLAPLSDWWGLRTFSDDLPYPVRPLPPKQQLLTRVGGEAFLTVQAAYFRTLQARYDFDLWTSFGIYPAGVGVSRFTAGADLPHVVRTMGYGLHYDEDLGYGFRGDPAVDRMIHDWASEATTVVALSDSIVDSCTDVGISRSKIEVIPCAVDLDRFDQIDPDPEEVRDRHGIPQDTFTFLSVARNHPVKGLDVLLDAVHLLHDRTKEPFQVAFVGRGMDDLAEKVADTPIESRISFVGFIGREEEEGVGSRYKLPPSPVIRIMKSSDAVVFPSRMETFGTVNIEAMAAGQPLVTTDATGCRDIVSPGKDGLQARAGDPESLARKMERLLEDDQLRERLRRGGRQTVKNEFTWSRVVSRYEEVFQAAIDAHASQAQPGRNEDHSQNAFSAPDEE